MKFINVALALLVSLAIGLGVFEGGLRLLGLGPPVTLNAFDADLGWSKTPSTTLRRGNAEGFEVEFTFNAAGLRDDAGVTAGALPDAYRVIALGDSFTLGFSVKRDDLFVDLLEGWWNAEGRGVQIVNTGTEGYSTDQEVAWLETHGAAWDPDLVLLFTYENDLFWNGQSHYTDLPKPRYTAAGTENPALCRPPRPARGTRAQRSETCSSQAPTRAWSCSSPGPYAYPRKWARCSPTGPTSWRSPSPARAVPCWPWLVRPRPSTPGSSWCPSPPTARSTPATTTSSRPEWASLRAHGTPINPWI